MKSLVDSILESSVTKFEFIKNARPDDGQKCIVVHDARRNEMFIATYVEHEDEDDPKSQAIWEASPNTYDVYSYDQWIAVDALIKLGLKI